MNRSGLDEGRDRPPDVRELEVEDAKRDESWEVKARVVEEEISFVVDLGLRMPYSPESVGIVAPPVA